MHGNGQPKPAEAKTIVGGSHKLMNLMRELSDDDDNDDSTTSTPSSSPIYDPAKPWLQDFNAYLSSKDHLGGQTIVQWWGVNAARYPVWAMLARDFLSIMASSVSSKRAFSSAGITISKRRNRLKADIVEALQCLKCMIKRDLLFRGSDDPSIAAEVDDTAVARKANGKSWDSIVEDEVDGSDSEVDDTEDAEVDIPMLDEI